ncbi:aldose 1-epimerase [Ramlibacter solisilvae]|uniref:Aldose epimerase n=1 Tax=Ramlibacter tataouinensis TaxID=94132 RepID=A0A127JVS7_9BURK|nr:aldose 1-epimerase [Ramlibacter tataouinensis]AMO24024.1 aldose epimerase [Ramlibacter tataouinensis]
MTDTPGLVELEAGALHAAIAPAVGGSLASLRARLPDGRWLDWLRPAVPRGLADRHPLAMASFPLLPFCGPMRHGRASFEGREIRFPPNHPAEDSPHPLHGIGWQQAWQVADAQRQAARLVLTVPATAAWPWRFSAVQRYQLSEQQLRVSIAVTNEDEAAMPAGIGHHPCFPHIAGTRLRTAAAGMWTTDHEALPVDVEVNEAVRRLREGALLADLHLDNGFTGWEREALVEWAGDEEGPPRSLLIEAAPPLDFFMLHSPRGYDHFCLAPVSQCGDALNLAPRWGADAIGGTRLEPGATLEAHFTLTPRWR